MGHVRSLLIFAALIAACNVTAAEVPHAALRYRAELVRTARFEWGMEAPVAAMAAQIQQESGWNPEAHSTVADGLAEFTPATATWISGTYPKLGPAQPYSPAWALRALVTYDHDLWQQTLKPPAPYMPATDCDHMAFALSAYNGGIGWVYRDQALTAKFAADPGQPGQWWRGVEFFSKRSPAAMKENRGYPRRILLVLQPLYLGWGPGVDCSAVHP